MPSLPTDTGLKIELFFTYQNMDKFNRACRDGNLKRAKKILQNNPSIDISAHNEYTFCLTCEYGQLEVAKWIFQIKPTINVFAGLSVSFCMS